MVGQFGGGVTLEIEGEGLEEMISLYNISGNNGSKAYKNHLENKNVNGITSRWTQIPYQTLYICSSN